MKTFADWRGEDLTGKRYNGSIDCSNAGITSLEGAPRIVDGDFDCSDNQLADLKGGPERVNGDFDVSGNPLKNDDDSPIVVKGRYIRDELKLNEGLDYDDSEWSDWFSINDIIDYGVDVTGLDLGRSEETVSIDGKEVIMFGMDYELLHHVEFGQLKEHPFMMALFDNDYRKYADRVGVLANGKFYRLDDIKAFAFDITSMLRHGVVDEDYLSEIDDPDNFPQVEISSADGHETNYFVVLETSADEIDEKSIEDSEEFLKFSEDLPDDDLLDYVVAIV